MKKHFLLIIVLTLGTIVTAQEKTKTYTPMKFASGKEIPKTPSEYVGKYYVDYLTGDYDTTLYSTKKKKTDVVLEVWEDGFVVTFTSVHGERITVPYKYSYKYSTWEAGGCIKEETISWYYDRSVLTGSLNGKIAVRSRITAECEKDALTAYIINPKHKIK